MSAEADDSDVPRQLGIVELDPAGPVGAEQHAEPEEREQDGQPRPRRTERDPDARSENRADQEKNGTFVHRAIFAAASPRGSIDRRVTQRPCIGRSSG